MVATPFSIFLKLFFIALSWSRLWQMATPLERFWESG